LNSMLNFEVLECTNVSVRCPDRTKEAFRLLKKRVPKGGGASNNRTKQKGPRGRNLPSAQATSRGRLLAGSFGVGGNRKEVLSSASRKEGGGDTRIQGRPTADKRFVNWGDIPRKKKIPGHSGAKERHGRKDRGGCPKQNVASIDEHCGGKGLTGASNKSLTGG